MGLTKVTDTNNHPPGGFKAWAIWSLAALFYLYEYFIRVAPSVMEEELLLDFQVRATHLAGALAAYYYIYAPMQIFAGMLFDRFGGRRLLVPATLFVALGCFVSIIPKEELWVISISRLLMGFGSAFGFVGVLYLASIWFPHRRLALISGMTTALGMVGAIIGEAPLAEAVDIWGWKPCLFVAGIFGFIIACLMLMAIPPTPSWEKKRRQEQIEEDNDPLSFLKTFLNVIKNPQTWIIGFIAGCLYMPLSVFGDLWGVQYIIHITGVSKAKAAGAVSMLYLGWLIGGPLIGIFSDKWECRKIPLLFSSILSSLLLVTLCSFPEMSLNMVYILLFLLGLAGCGQVIAFVASIEINNIHAKGTAIATCNMIVMSFGGVFQHLFGFVLDTVMDYQGVSHSLDYTPESYQVAMLILPLMMVFAVIASLFMRETFLEFENN